MSLHSEVIRIINAWIASGKKISQLPALPTDVDNADEFEVARGGTSYRATGAQLPSGGGGGTQNLQEVLDEGSTATITTDFAISKTGDGQISLGASGLTLLTVNDPIQIDAGTNEITIQNNSISRFQTFSQFNNYSSQATGAHRFYGNTAAGVIRLMEAPSNGTNYIGLKAPEDVTTLQTYTFPAAGPAADGYQLASTTGGQLSWVAPGGGGSSAWGGITGTLSDQTDLQAALDLKEALFRTFDRKTANYPLVLTDASRGIEMNVASANTVTVPLNSSVAFPVGTLIPVVQYGAGLTSIVATGGVTINTSAGNLDSPGQYAPMFLRKIATNEWYLWNGVAGGGGAVDSVNGQTGVVVLDAGDIANTPSGSISATDVQAAINELATEKAPLASPALTGTPTVPTAATTTNTTQAASTAFVQQEIAAKTVGIQDFNVPAAALWPRITGGCAPLSQTEISTSLFNIQTLDFDQTTQEFAQFQIVLPRRWNNGTVTAVFYWTAASGSGDVQWGISGGAYSNDDALSVAFGSAVTVDDTLITANDVHVTSATSAMTLAGTPADADFLAFQISRNPASDTLNADAKLLLVSIRITSDAAIDA